MGKVNDLLVAESENYISALLGQKLAANFIYHNFSHALRIKKYADTIGKQTGLTADEMNILRICALFHGAGYVNSYEQYNEESMLIASAYLAGQGLDQQTTGHVSDIIRALKQPQDPKDKIAEVLCDADMMYIATENAIEQIDLLYEETAMLKPNFKKRLAFEKQCIHSFTTHTYFTEYGKTVLQPIKEAAVRRLADRQQRRKLLEKKKESLAKKGITYSRGVDTMFRVTARNQINLNSIADNKSNILISVNAIIISIIITMLAGNIGNMSQDIVPILVFLIICLVTIIIAIMSTRPNLVNNKFTKEDIKNKSVDLTFSGILLK